MDTLSTRRSEDRKPGSYVPAWLAAFFIMALALGALLRLWNLADMEYKGDERFAFDRSQHIGVSEPWPDLGMMSGGGIRNPGLSIWIFAILARVYHATTPLGLDRAVAVTSIVAFVLFFVAAYFFARPREKEILLWGGAIAAVSPFALLLHRKLWAPSTLPIFCVVFLCGWWTRGRYAGAIAWGLVGALVGQLHMGAFFFAFAFVAWELTVGRMRRDRPPTKWLGWVGGSIVGSIPLLPWIQYVLSGADHGESWRFSEIVSGRFLRVWFDDALGLGMDYSLGVHYADFLRYPLFGDADYYPALYMHGASFCAGMVVLVAGVFAAARWLRAGGSLRGAIRTSSDLAHTLGAAFFGFGLALTFSGVHIFRQYLHVTFPLEWVSFAYLAFRATRRPRAILAVMWCAQLGLSATFLHYIHVNGGALGADYGPAYSTQTRQTRGRR